MAQPYESSNRALHASRQFIVPATLGRKATISCLFAVVAKVLGLGRTLRSGIIASYHPEHHYMRGPGPKWREKHPGAPVA
jgi:hypothetical protein